MPISRFQKGFRHLNLNSIDSLNPKHLKPFRKLDLAAKSVRPCDTECSYTLYSFTNMVLIAYYIKVEFGLAFPFIVRPSVLQWSQHDIRNPPKQLKVCLWFFSPLQTIYNPSPEVSMLLLNDSDSSLFGWVGQRATNLFSSYHTQSSAGNISRTPQNSGSSRVRVHWNWEGASQPG